MANVKVQLYRKCKTPTGWKRYPAAMASNGKVKPGFVLVSGVEVSYSEGHYELGSYSGPKRVWTRLTGNATDALAALKTAQKKASAIATAEAEGIQVVTDPKRVAIEDARHGYKEAAMARGA